MSNINQLYNQYKKILKEYISLKSVSTDPKYKPEIEKTVKWLKAFLTNQGFKVKIFKNYQNPIIYAEIITNKNLPTALVYGHYDVQPAQYKDGWIKDPFTLFEDKKRLYARGVVDNKGQHLIHLLGIIEAYKKKSLRFNIKIILEGNEETGSAGLTRFIKDKKALLKSDLIVISDGEMPYRPMISVSFRGTVNLKVTVKTAKNAVHSGLYGGVVPAASVEAARLIARLYSEEYKINIPEFYENRIDPTHEEKEHCKEVMKYKKKLFKDLGFKKTFTREFENECLVLGFDTVVIPTGFSSGYTEEGYANIVPNQAEIKFNLRIPYGQDPKKIARAFVKGIKRLLPHYVSIEGGEIDDIAYPVKVDINSKWHKEAITLLEKIYKSKVLFDYCGATLPIVYDIKTILKQDPLLISLANDDCNMHGVNENFNINLIKKGLEFAIKWWGE